MRTEPSAEDRLTKSPLAGIRLKVNKEEICACKQDDIWYNWNALKNEAE